MMFASHLTLPGRVPPPEPKLGAEPELDRARYEDRSELLALLSSAIPSCSPETVWQLPWNWTSYLVLRDANDGIIAAGSLQEVAGDRVELRGIVVAPHRRSEGLASRIIDALIRRAERLEKDLLCVTKSPSFFTRFGFETTRLDWLSPQRRAVHEADGRPRTGMVRRAFPLPLGTPSSTPAPRISTP